MKKKLLCLMLAASMSASLMACKEKDDEDTSANLEENADTEEAELEDSTLEDGEYLLKTGYDVKAFYTVDSAGNKVGTFDYSDIEVAAKAAGYDDIYNFYVEAAADGVIYFEYCSYESEGTTYSLVAVVPSTGEVTTVMTTKTGFMMDYVDIYQDKIYVGSKDSDKLQSVEQCFVKDENSLTFTEDEDAYQEIKGSYPQNNANGRGMSIARCLDEIGFVLLDDFSYKNPRCYKLTEDGNQTKIKAFDGQDVFVRAYNKDYVVYETYDTDYSSQGIYVYDFEKEDSVLVDDTEYASSIGLSGDTLYYDIRDYGEFNVTSSKVYAYDLTTDKSDIFYSIDAVPGLENTDTYLTLAGDHLFTVNMTDDGLVSWYRMDGANSLTDIDAPVMEKTAYQYGTLISGSNTVDCPNCGTTIYKVYTEAFVLDDKYSSFAATINDALKQTMDNQLAYAPESPEDECEYHQEDPDMYCETDSYTVDNVTIINNQFLIVDSDSYWYGGGAHGMPGRGERIFDLTTGTEYSFADFYKGTEEELKTLVAEKVMADYENNPDRFFAASPEEAYQQAYDSVSIEYANIQFTEDKVYFYFYPYDLGSYAEGFMDFEFTYQEMFGTSTLSL